MKYLLDTNFCVRYLNGESKILQLCNITGIFYFLNIPNPFSCNKVLAQVASASLSGNVQS